MGSYYNSKKFNYVWISSLWQKSFQDSHKGFDAKDEYICSKTFELVIPVRHNNMIREITSALSKFQPIPTSGL